MTTPLFYIDLSEDARDYRHTALEPGLPLLDRQGVNFQILRKWLGDYVAEPEWRNTNVCAFYMAEEERGRLENVDCNTVTQAELEKQFAPDLDAIRNKIKKVKAESSTESMVLRILKKTIAEQTNDLANSDFDSYFFKCRAGDESWRLVWCCGFQRGDLEPLRARVWHTPDGDFLGVRPPDGGKAKKRKRKGPLAILLSPSVLLLLLLLIGGFAYATWPRLVVTPAEWTGPLGSRIEYKVADQRWFFFKKDVTSRSVAQPTDPRVVEFDPHGKVATTKSEGQAYISFMVGNQVTQAFVDVTPLSPPDSLAIEPSDKIKVPVGSTKQLKAIGKYKDGRTVDMTALVDWWEQPDKPDKRLLTMKESQKGLIEGTSAGATKVVARYPTPLDKEKDIYAETALDVDVNQAKYVSLELSLDPFKFSVNQSSRIDVMGVDEAGEKHSLTGSSLLKFKVDPTTVATVDQGYLVGHAEAPGALKVSYGELDKSVAFTVQGRLKVKFDVQPSNAEAIPVELVGLNVTTGNDDKIDAVSSDPAVVEVWRTTTENAGFEVFLAARSVGEAEITVSQGVNSKVVKVTVTEGAIASLQFSPPVMSLQVGRPEAANLQGTTEDGRIIHVVPDALRWEKQPRVENVELDKTTLLMLPLAATEVPQDLKARLLDTSLVAEGTVDVRGGMDLARLDTEVDVWGVHPPVARRGRHINQLGDVYLDHDAGGLVLDQVADGSLLRDLQGRTLFEVNGRRLADMTEAELAEYLRLHPLGEGDIIKYLDSDGLVGTFFPGGSKTIRDFKLLEVTTRDVAADGLNAEIQAYLRLADDYRLVDKDGKPLSAWTPQPADATPVLVSITKVPRTTNDDYEIYVERKDGKRFQVTFRLGAEGPATIERVPRRIIETDGDVLERAIGIPETRLKSTSTVPVREPVREVVAPREVRTTTTTTTRHGRGGAVTGGTGSRTVESRTTTSSPASPSGSSTRAPASSSPSSAPNSPAPTSPSPAPEAKPSPAPAKPDSAPSKPDSAPAKPDSAPAKPDSAPAKPDSAPAKPNPSDAKPSPADDAEPDDGSDTPNPENATPANVIPAEAEGSNSRGTPDEPDAYGSGTRRPFGSATRAPADQPAGSLTRSKVGLVRKAPEKKSSSQTSDETGAKSSKVLNALKKYNRDWRSDDKPK